MKSIKRKVAVMAIVGGAGLVGLASTAAASSGPNEQGSNCHGVVMSYFATSDMSPGQLHKDYGMSVKDVQTVADILCGP